MSEYHLPEGWDRKLQSYRDSAGDSTATTIHPSHKAAKDQRERFDERLRADERRMKELLK